MIKYRRGILPNVSRETFGVSNDEKYSDVIYTFDIETTSAWVKNGKVMPFDFSKPAEYYDDAEKVGLCYIWQFGINDEIYFGRELSEVAELIEELRTKDPYIPTVWVHNLSFEFQWLLDVFEFSKIFARSPHKVMYADTEDGTRFRCSYFLTRLSLDQWAKQKRLPVEKLSGEEFNYNEIRTPKTQLTHNQLAYCEHDCLVMFHGLKEYLEMYEHICKIPLTQTGEVRRDVKALFKNNMKHFYKMTKMLPNDAQEYALLKSAFAGGYTHCNYMYTGEFVHNVKSYDEASAYPWAMFSGLYADEPFEQVDDFYKYRDDKHVAILDVTFVGLRSKLFNNYISYYKAYEKVDAVNDNGRVSKASLLSIIITSCDFDIIEASYEYDEIIFNRVFVAKADSMPRDYIMYMLGLYSDKTTMKNIDELYPTYMKKKEKINALYGMEVTSIIQENVDLIDDDWEVENLTPAVLTEKLQEMKSKPWKNWNSYAQGLFVPAWARRNLWALVCGLDGLPVLDADIIYMDTDSHKVRGNHEDAYALYNENVSRETLRLCKKLNCDVAMLRPVDSKGKAHPLGVFEYEETYKTFTSLGAKRYAYEDANGDLHITVSGVNKKKGVNALNGNIKNFTDGLVFDYDNCGKLISTYISDQRPLKWQAGKYDEYISSNKHAINLQPTTYTMSLERDYVELLSMIADDAKQNLSLSAEELHTLSEGGEI